ncbi:MAG: chaperonin GroEL, partial [Cellvibrionaceae bacterium]
MIKKGVIFSPEASKNLKLGFDQMALLMAGTLGPSQGIVLNEKDTPGPPEILTDSATIARRIIALPQRQQDMGAMILRQMVWRMKTRMGDGAATTAVLGQAILDEATKLLTAGINLIDIQAGVRQTADVAIAQ